MDPMSGAFFRRKSIEEDRRGHRTAHRLLTCTYAGMSTSTLPTSRRLEKKKRRNSLWMRIIQCGRPMGGKSPALYLSKLKLSTFAQENKNALLSRKIACNWQLPPPQPPPPSWSTVGNKIAFTGHKDPPLPPDRKPGDPFPPGWEDKQTIFIMNSDGSGFKQLVAEAGPKASGTCNISKWRRGPLHTKN